MLACGKFSKAAVPNLVTDCLPANRESLLSGMQLPNWINKLRLASDRLDLTYTKYSDSD